MDPDSCLLRWTELCNGITVMPLSLGAAFALLLALMLLYTSGFVSASEIAFFSLSPSDLNDIEEENHPSDSKIKALLEDSERLLAAAPAWSRRLCPGVSGVCPPGNPCSSAAIAGQPDDP